ncbi:MAG: hypothetical protein H6Q66_1911 [Firmicutes bacterium]|nr:hypothetical protein [Bacillota bacterium]
MKKVLLLVICLLFSMSVCFAGEAPQKTVFEVVDSPVNIQAAFDASFGTVSYGEWERLYQVCKQEVTHINL